MWKLLPLLVVLANLILTVTPSRDTHTIIKVTNTAEAGAAAATDGGNGTAGAAAAAASSTTIIKNSHHHKKCAAHEKYVKCPEKLCQPQLCEEVGIPQCSSHEEKNGKEEKNDSETDVKESCKGPAACVCKEDYVRNDDGICMPAKNCPSCGNDKNATYGCGVNCGRWCSNYDKGPVSCAECHENSCDCKEGFVYDDILKFCVLPEDCSPASREDSSSTTEKAEEGTTKNNEDDGDDENMTSSTVSSESNEQPSSTESSLTRSTTRRHKHKTTKKPMKTSTTTTEEPDSSTKESEMSTERSGSEPSTKSPSSTRRPKTTKTPKTTTESEEETTTEGSDDSCGNDKNATRGCGVNCGRQCSTYNKGPVSCDEVCYENSCDCKEGFVFDDILRFCVLPEDCSLRSSEDSSSTTEKAEETTESNEDDGDDENMPSSTESSVTRSTTRRHKHTSTKKPNTTTKSSGGHHPSTKSPTSTRRPKTTKTPKTTTESEEETTTEGPDDMPSSTESSVTRSTTRRHKHTSTKKPNTTTKSSGGHHPSTKSPTSTRRPKTTKTPKTTTESEEETTTEGSDDSCGNDKNATRGCGVNCGRQCSTYNKGPVSCDEVCYEKSCDCKEGFVFDDILRFCVLPEDCSLRSSEDSSSTTEKAEETTESNEDDGDDENMPSSTESSVTRSTTRRHKHTSTKKPNTTTKSSGGHHPSTKSPTSTRRPKSTKTPKTTTESGEETTTEGSDDSCGNDKNATQGCGVNCGRKCSNYEKHVSCGEVCYENGCDCKEGFVFDEYVGFCVLPEDCSLTSSGESTHTTRQPKSTKRPTSTRRPKTTKMPKTTTESEEETTTEGSDDSCGNDMNATQGCGVNCGRRCSNYDKGAVSCAEVCYENSCDCKEGFVFDDYVGVCVLPEDCSDSSNEVSEMTTEESGIEMTTKRSGHEVTTKSSGMGSNTCRHKTTKKPRTTTKSSGESTLTTHKPKRTKTTRKPTTKTPRTTTESEEETTTEGSEETTPTENSEETTTDSSIEETTTVKGPKDCRGKHESYSKCAPSCPQMTCNDYLDGVKCHKKSSHKGTCKPECRCKSGYYKDEEGNCLNKRECKRRAKSTTMASSSTTAKPNNQGSTTTMMMTTPEDPNCEDVAKELFVKGNLVYTTKLLTDLSEREPRDNVLVGGASILFLISQLAVSLTSKSTLRKELLNVLNFKNTEQIRCYMPKVSANLTATYPDIDFKLFCKIYANEHYALTDDFIESTTKIFGMGPENLNFKSPKAVKKINSDVALNTENSMLHYMKARTLKSLDGLLLLDAEEFEGIWEKQFHPSATNMKDFYTQGKIIKIPTMHSKGIFLFAHSNRLNAKVLKLNFTGGRFSLVIILPNALDGIKDLLKKMENPENILSALDSLKHDYLKISLPKFNLSVANRLKLSSEAANVKELFNKGTTALKDIGSAKPPYVGDILQKIDFKVTEYGMGNKSDMDFTKPEEITHISKYGHTHIFKADHPFVIFLCFDDTLVVQAGLVNEQ